MGWGFFWLAWTIPSFTGSAVLSRFLVGWASRVGALDRPNERSSHTRVTPRGGGLAIVGLTAIGGVLGAFMWPESRIELLAYVGASLGIAYVSWRDDLKPVSNRVRFGVHLVSALLVAAVADPIKFVDMGGLGALDLGVAAWPLTIIWIVGMTNAFNFMDGVDGIAGITAASAGTAVGIGAACLDCPAVAAVSAAFAASSLGFLTCNWQPARIFMGDVGSAFCGFSIASLPIVTGPGPTSRLVTVALFAMWPFIFDTLYTIIRRLRRGENVFAAHRTHVYQRLVISGWTHRSVSGLYGGISLVAAAISLVPFIDEAATPVLTIFALGFLLASGTMLLLLARNAEPTPMASRN